MEELRNILAQAWSNRKSPVAFGMDIFAYKTQTNITLHLLSSRLCDVLLEQGSVGVSPSPLVLEYLKYALSIELVHSLHFFLRVNFYVDPARPSQLSAFLGLITDFVEHIYAVFEDQEEEQPKRRKSLHDTSKFGRETEKEQELTEHKKYSSVSMAYIKVVTLLLSTIMYGINNMDQESAPVQANLIKSFDTISHLIQKVPRALAFLYIGHEEHSQAWKSMETLIFSVEAKSQELGVEKMTPIMSHWVEFKRSLHILFVRGKILHDNISSAGLSQQGFQGGSTDATQLPWLALTLLVDDDIVSKRFLMKDDCFLLFESLRVCSGTNHLDFYSSLWIAGLRLFRFQKLGTNLWNRAKDFLVVKIPMFMIIWESRRVNIEPHPSGDRAKTAESVPIKNIEAEISSSPKSQSREYTSKTVPHSKFNDVEMSLESVTRFPSLFERPETFGLSAEDMEASKYNILEGIIRGLVVRKLVNIEHMRKLFPQCEIFVPPASRQINLENVINGNSPCTVDEVEQIMKLITPNLRLDKMTQAVMTSLTNSLVTRLDIQEHIVSLVFTVIDMDSDIDPDLLCSLFRQLSNPICLDIIALHGRLPALIAYLAEYCDFWGGSPPKSARTHYEHFGTAFLLLVQLLSLYDVKGSPHNQKILQQALESVYTRNIETSEQFFVPVVPTASTQPVTPPLRPNTKKVKNAFIFENWYSFYIFGFSPHSPFCISEENYEIEESGPSSRSKEPSVQQEGISNQSSIGYYQTVVPETSKTADELFQAVFHKDKKEKIQQIAHTYSPWQVLWAIPLFTSMLYQNCSHGGGLNNMVNAIIELGKYIPHVYERVLDWLFEELLRGVPVKDASSAQTPLPLAIFADIMGNELPDMVMEAVVAKTLGALERLKQHYTIINTFFQKMLQFQKRQLRRGRTFGTLSIGSSTSQTTSSTQPPSTMVHDVISFLSNESSPNLSVELPNVELSRINPRSLAHLVFKEVMDCVLSPRVSSAGPSASFALRVAEAGAYVIGVYGGMASVSELYCGILPFIAHRIKLPFQAWVTAYFSIICGIFAGIEELPISTGPVEETLGIKEPLSMHHLYYVICDMLETFSQFSSASSSPSTTPITTLQTSTTLHGSMHFPIAMICMITALPPSIPGSHLLTSHPYERNVPNVTLPSRFTSVTVSPPTGSSSSIHPTLQVRPTTLDASRHPEHGHSYFYRPTSSTSNSSYISPLLAIAPKIRLSKAIRALGRQYEWMLLYIFDLASKKDRALMGRIFNRINNPTAV